LIQDNSGLTVTITVTGFQQGSVIVLYVVNLKDNTVVDGEQITDDLQAALQEYVANNGGNLGENTVFAVQDFIIIIDTSPSVEESTAVETWVIILICVLLMVFVTFGSGFSAFMAQRRNNKPSYSYQRNKEYNDGNTNQSFILTESENSQNSGEKALEATNGTDVV